jgi:hypothetical protein
MSEKIYSAERDNEKILLNILKHQRSDKKKEQKTLAVKFQEQHDDAKRKIFLT